MRLLWLGAALLAIFLTQLGNPLAGGHSDEPLYIGIAQEMMARHEWILPYFHGQVAFYKPPLVYWMMILCFKTFGFSLFAARLPAALCGAATAVVTALLSEEIGDCGSWGLPPYGEALRDLSPCGDSPLVAGWLTATTIPGIYAFSRGALMDVPLLLFISLSLYLGVRATKTRSAPLLALAFMCVGFCSLLKGPVGSLIPIPPLVFLLYKTKTFSLLKNSFTLLGLLLGFDLIVFWPVAVTLRGFGDLWLHFFVLQENFGKFTSQLDPTTHVTPGSVIWIHLLSQFLPWSFFLLAALILTIWKRRGPGPLFLLIWIFEVVFIFLIPQKKLSHYTLPAIVPCSLLAAGVIMESSGNLLLRTAFKLTGFILALSGLLLLLVLRVSGGPFNQFVVLCSAVSFLIAALWSFKEKLQLAAYAVAVFLFFYALGLPGLMSTLKVAELKPILQNQRVYAYHLDLNILGVALQKTIEPMADLGTFSVNNTSCHSEPPQGAKNLLLSEAKKSRFLASLGMTCKGIVILRKTDAVDFVQHKISISQPLLAWDNWKDHIRMLDILQAAISGDPKLIHEQIIAVRL